MNSDLGKRIFRLYEAGVWRWMPGMMIIDWSTEYWSSKSAIRGRVLNVGNKDTIVYSFPNPSNPSMMIDYSRDIGPWLEPYTEDPATLGCMLELVREAWNSPAIHVAKAGDTGDSPWILCSYLGRPVPKERVGGGEVIGEDTEFEALIAGLECARRLLDAQHQSNKPTE